MERIQSFFVGSILLAIPLLAFAFPDAPIYRPDYYVPPGQSPASAAAMAKQYQGLIEQQRSFISQLNDANKALNNPKLSIRQIKELNFETDMFLRQIGKYQAMIARARLLLRGASLAGRIPIRGFFAFFNIIGAHSDYVEMNPTLRGEHIRNEIRAIDDAIDEVDKVIADIPEKKQQAQEGLDAAGAAVRAASNAVTNNPSGENLMDLNNAIRIHKKWMNILDRLEENFKALKTLRDELNNQRSNLYNDSNNIT